MDKDTLDAIRKRDLQTPEFWFKQSAGSYGLREQQEAFAIQDRRALLDLVKELTFL